MSGPAGMVAFDDFGGEAIEHARNLLVGIPNGVERAVKSALPRAASALRSESTKAIRETYDISAANLRIKDNVKMRYSFKTDYSCAYVTFRGRKIPLYRYNGTSPKFPTADESRTVKAILNGHFRSVHPGVAASAHQLKSTSATKFKNAFVAEMKSGHIGIFERTGGVTSSGNNEIKELKGSSVPQMLGSTEVQEKLVGKAAQKFEERLEHEIMRLMNGWGER